MKKIAISQSNYIPWKGYFDLINMVDEFILYDDMQYTKRDWRNRNKIKTPQGSKWLSVPVEVKGKFTQKISETKLSDSKWGTRHWNTIKHCYSKTDFFKELSPIFEELYIGIQYKTLTELNYSFIREISKQLGISTNLSFSMDYNLIEGKTERIIDLCKQAGATEYISGPAAKGYIVPELFEEENIKLSWIDYSGYKEYRQKYPPFNHYVSIIDLLFNEGKESPKYMKTF